MPILHVPNKIATRVEIDNDDVSGDTLLLTFYLVNVRFSATPGLYAFPKDRSYP